MRSTPGSALPVVREARLPGINFMTLLIKAAGGRESVMVHLGRRNLVSEQSGDRFHEVQLRVASIVRQASPGKMQLLIDGVCIKLLTRITRIFAHAFGLGAGSWRLLMGPDATLTRLPTFMT
jgi:hypothetical protein